MKKTKILFFSFVFVLLFVSVLCFGESVKSAVATSLQICASVLIPSIFPITCISCVAEQSGILSYLAKVSSPFCQSLFKVSGYFVPVFLISLVSGYPVGATLCASLYEKGQISLSERNSFALVCCSAGPGFVLLAVGVNLYSSYAVGQILLISHILATIVCAFFGLLFFGKNKTEPTQVRCYFDICDGVVCGVAKAILSTFSICGYTVLFFVILNLCKQLLGKSFVFVAISSVLEVTSAVVTLYKSVPVYIISAIIGFGGFSVIFQIFSALKNNRPKLLKFVAVRTIHGCVSGLFCFVLLKLIPIAIPVSELKQVDMQLCTKNIYFSTSLVFLLLVFLNFFYKQKREKEYL